MADSNSSGSSLEYSLDFISVGCNRQPTSVSWAKNGLIAFAGSRFVGIYDPKAVKLLETIPAHADRVNAVLWVPRCDVAPEARWHTPEEEIASASVDKKIKFWRRQDSKAGNSSHKWVATATLEGHKDSVTSIQLLPLHNGGLLVASSSADNSIMLWRREPGQNDFKHLQTISFTPKMIETVALTFFPGTTVPLLAAGGVDMMIHLYAAVDGGNKFVKAASLQGHEDWIRFVSFVDTDDGDVLLASSSQDKRIRLWRISPVKSAEEATAKLDPAALLAKLDLSHDGNLSLSQHAHVINLGVELGKFTVLLESVMLGHEEWVNSVCWAPPKPSEADKTKKTQPMRLLSASMDRNACIWEIDPATGIWIDDTRVGEVGGNQLGFFGSQFGPSGDEIIVCGWNGAFHIWRCNSEGDWTPVIPVSGHFDEVRDLDWDPAGEYFISVSKDQTARLFAPWLKDGLWHEIARPQVHGYDMSCLVLQPNLKHRLVSGAEEKVIRVFDAPRAFVESLSNITQGQAAAEADLVDRATTANVPPLGLTNKPVFDSKTTDSTAAEDTLAEAHPQLAQMLAAASAEDGGDDGDGGLGGLDAVGPRAPLLLDSPPLEEQLMQRTLWPETHKLYGHGNELVCICASHRGDLIASACSAKTPDQAGIRVWDSKTYKQIAEMPGHKLTVIQLEFSHDDNFLLSVSRDLGHCIYQVTRDTSSVSLKLVAKLPKAHTRISWGCSWAPDDKVFASCSRDGTIKVWRFDSKASQADHMVTVSWKVELDESVTAVAFAPLPESSPYYLLACGQENGAIQFFAAKKTADGANLVFTHYGSIDARHTHVATVRRIRWRPKQQNVASTKTMTFASASTDRSVRLFTIDIKSLL